MGRAGPCAASPLTLTRGGGSAAVRAAGAACGSAGQAAEPWARPCRHGQSSRARAYSRRQLLSVRPGLDISSSPTIRGLAAGIRARAKLRRWFPIVGWVERAVTSSWACGLQATLRLRLRLWCAGDGAIAPCRQASAARRCGWERLFVKRWIQAFMLDLEACARRAQHRRRAPGLVLAAGRVVQVLMMPPAARVAARPTSPPGIFDWEALKLGRAEVFPAVPPGLFVVRAGKTAAVAAPPLPGAGEPSAPVLGPAVRLVPFAQRPPADRRFRRGVLIILATLLTGPAELGLDGHADPDALTHVASVAGESLAGPWARPVSAVDFVMRIRDDWLSSAARPCGDSPGVQRAPAEPAVPAHVFDSAAAEPAYAAAGWAVLADQAFFTRRLAGRTGRPG